MAKKNVDAKLKVTDVPLQDGVDAEVAYSLAENANADKQWLEETSKVWANRQNTEKQQESSKAKGDAVVNVADAAGAVGEKSGASIILAEASNKDEAAPVVTKKDDDSDHKGGYIWGGLGLLGLVGVALAAGGGGGGGGGGAPAPLQLDGLVIDDPVANAIVYRDVHGDGYLHVIDLGDGNYLVDPDQAVVVTNDEGKFANLGGSGLIISTGINRLPIKVFANAEDLEDNFGGTEVTADIGYKLFSSQANFESDVSINDGNHAYIVGENQIFDSIVISSGLELSVQGADVTLVTGVTGLVHAYAENNDLDPDDEDDIRQAVEAVAEMFGTDLTDASDEEIMSFLLGGYDIAGIESAGNLNQEIYSVINSLTFASEALAGDGELTFRDHGNIFEFALSSIVAVQAQRFEDNPEDPNLQSFALNDELLDQVIATFYVVVDQFYDNDDFDVAYILEGDRQLFIDIAKNHADLGGGAPDIYHAYNGDDAMNIVNDEGLLLQDYDVEVAGNITLLNNDYESSQYLDFWSVDLMSSNILSIAYADSSDISTDFYYVSNASASEMSNGTLTYDPNGDESTSIGDITVKASGYDSWSHINFWSSDLTVSGNILVEAGDKYAHAELDFDWDDMVLNFDDVDVTVNAYGTDSYAYFEADHEDFTGRINNIHLVANREGVDNADVVSGPFWEDGSFASADIYIDGEVGNITLEAFGEDDSVVLELETDDSMDDPLRHVYTMSDLNIAGWGDLQVGQIVELYLGYKSIVPKLLTAEISDDDFVDGYLSVDKVIEKLMLDSDFESLNVVIKTAGETDESWNVESGIVIHYLDPDSLDYSLLKLAGEVVSSLDVTTDSYTDQSVEFTDSIITLNAYGEDSTVSADIEEGTGRVESIALTSSGNNSDVDIDIELFGLLGDVTVTASGYDSNADIELESTYGYLEYDNSVINVTATGQISRADLAQEAYATGVIDSITVKNIGSNEGFGSIEADADIGGDITIDSEINVYSRSSYDLNNYTSDQDFNSRLTLGNLYNDYGLTSVFTMDDVAITVEAYGNDAHSELTTDMSTDYSTDYVTNGDSVITGNISELNVIASGYDADLTPYDPVLAANATSIVDLNLHGSIEEINITADHVSTAYVHLAGDVDAAGLLDVTINNSNSSEVTLHLHDVEGEINSINVDTSNEGASTYIDVDTSDSIEEVNITTRSDAETIAYFDITGEGNFIENLTISTLGSSFNENYTTVTDVVIDQESHGGIVNIYNSASDRWADTRLTYDGNYQADQIIINGQSPRQLTGNLFAGINDSPSVTSFDIYGNTYVAGQTANIDGFGIFSISANGDYTFVAANDWLWSIDPNISYNTDSGVTGAHFDLESVFNDGQYDSFGLQINMDDQDVYSYTNNTPLENNMTTITGLTNAGIDNYYENYIQFNDLDDDNYTYEPTVVGQQGPIDLNISHYSDGLNGWLGGNTYFDDVEGSRNIGNGFYGSFNEFFDAAQYGIASEYAFIDLDAFNAAGNAGFDDQFWTNISLTISWVDANGNPNTIYLNSEIGNTNLGGSLGGDAVSVVNGLNADTDWDGVPTQLNQGLPGYELADGAWSNFDDNLTVFVNDDNTLGIRLGEGYLTDVSFQTNVWEDDNQGPYISNDIDLGSSTKGYLNDLDDYANFEEGRIQFVEGGGYFFGMVFNDDTSTYRGVLAMDDDGEGVTKLIELADVIATDQQADAIADGDQPNPAGYGYDEFSSAYIGIASGYEGNWPDSSTGFEYETTAFKFGFDS